MRLLHVSDCYLPQLGGIEMHVHDLATRQRDAGDDVRVATTTGDQSPGTDQGWVVRLGQVHGRRAPRLSLAVDQLADLLLTSPVDVVHVHVSVLSPFATGAARMATRLGFPTVVTVHSLWSRLGPLPAIARTVLGLQDWPLTWSAVSTRAAEPLRRMLGPAIPVHVLPNAVDVHRWQAAVDTTLEGGASPTTIVSVMRMTRRKRPLPLVRMLRRVRAGLPERFPIEAVIVGDGPQRSAVERYLRRHRMESWVRLTGELDRTDIRRELEAAAVYVAPAELESFGIAALEARAVGLPVVASRRGGVGEFIADGVEGLLVPDDDAMVAALAGLLSDPLTRSAMAQHNRRVLPALDWSSVCADNARLYARAIDDASVRRAMSAPAEASRVRVGGVR